MSVGAIWFALDGLKVKHAKNDNIEHREVHMGLLLCSIELQGQTHATLVTWKSSCDVFHMFYRVYIYIYSHL